MLVRNKVLLGLFGLVVLALAAAYVYFFHLGGVRTIIQGQITNLIGENSPVNVSIGKISGDLVSGLVVEDVVVTYRDSAGVHTLAQVNRITGGYSLAELLAGNYHLEYAYLDSARLTVFRDADGNPILPIPVSGGGGGGGPEFVVEDLMLENVDITILGTEDTTYIRNFTLTGSLMAEAGSYSGDIRQLSFSTSLEGVGLTAASGKFTFADAQLYLQDFILLKDSTRLRTSGTLNVDTFVGDFQFSADQLSLPELTRYIGPSLNGVLDLTGQVHFDSSGIRGSVSLAGDLALFEFDNVFAELKYSNRHLVLDTLYGSILGQCTIDGSGEIDFSQKPERYRLIADLKNFDLNRLVSNTFPSDLSGHIDLTGRSFSSDDLLLTADLQLRESSFDEYPIQEAEGTLRITTDSLQFVDSFRVDYFENRIYAGGSIEYSNDIDLWLYIDLNNLDRYRQKFFIDQPGGRGRAWATLSGATSDPDLSGRFVSDSLWLYGMYADSADIDVDIARFLTGTVGQVDVTMWNGSAWGVQYDTAYSHLSLDSTTAVIDTAFFGNPFSSMSASGSLDYAAEPQQLSLDSLTINLAGRMFYNQSNIRVDIDTLGFDFVNVEIGNDSALVTARGEIDYDEAMDLDVSIASLPIAPWLGLFDETIPIDGYISADITAGGNFAQPRFSLQGDIDSLTYRGLLLGALTARTTYDNRRLDIDTMEINSGSGYYVLDGYAYLDLALTADSIDRVLERPFNMHFVANDNRFELVSLFMPSVEYLGGDFRTDIRLSGIPEEPHLEGFATMTDVVLKYFDIADTIYTDSAYVTMRDNQIVIDSIGAFVHERPGSTRKNIPHAVVRGTITVQSLDNFAYDLDVETPQRVAIQYDLADIRGSFRADLEVVGASPPLVQGDVTVHSLMYQVNFSSASETSPLLTTYSDKKSWDLDLNIDIPANYWIKNDDIDAEFSGFINLIREDGNYRFIGELEILRGRAFLFDKIFQIEPYSTVTFNDIEELNPELNITATTIIRGAPLEDGSPGSDIELTIQVTGTLENPEINTAGDDTTFTRADIIPLLVANQYGGGTSGGQLEQRLAQLLGSQLSQIGTQQLSQILGVETFQIDPSYTGESGLTGTRVTLGTYVGSSLYVYGRSSVDFQSGQTLGFEYRLSRSLLLEGRRDEDELYHLNLNLHWEFEW
jgi:autotransporter translocation and assembly factor TamB